LPETVAALQAFRKRHSDAQRISGQLNAQPTTVDLAHYRSVLKNKAIIDEAEKALRDFKPVTYDVGSHIKAIETFETKAVRIFFLFTLPFSDIDHVSKNKLNTNFVVPTMPPHADCQGEGDRSEDRHRAEGSPSDAFQHPGRASLRGSDGTFLPGATRVLIPS
jgi:hypothetical protein